MFPYAGIINRTSFLTLLLLVMAWAVITINFWLGIETIYAVCEEGCLLQKAKYERLEELVEAYPYASTCRVEGDTLEELRGWCDE